MPIAGDRSIAFAAPSVAASEPRLVPSLPPTNEYRRDPPRVEPNAAPPLPVTMIRETTHIVERSERERMVPIAATPREARSAGPSRPSWVVPVATATPMPPRLTQADSSESRPPEPAPAPRVEVTIGTVEVRAIVPSLPPAAPRPAPRASAPPVSLNEYLNQRRSSRP